jgi:DNA excision repair protein ERCC-4
MNATLELVSFGNDFEARKLPALRSLAVLADLRPVILCDTREQTPLQFTRLLCFRATLATGDYSAAGLEHEVAIERKSIPDLIHSLTAERARFMREVERLRAYPFARLLIIGTEAQIAAGDYRSSAQPRAILHSLYSIEARGLPVVYAATPNAAADMVERWIWWKARAVVESANTLLRGMRRFTKPETQTRR